MMVMSDFISDSRLVGYKNDCQTPWVDVRWRLSTIVGREMTGGRVEYSGLRPLQIIMTCL